MVIETLVDGIRGGIKNYIAEPLKKVGFGVLFSSFASFILIIFSCITYFLQMLPKTQYYTPSTNIPILIYSIFSTLIPILFIANEKISSSQNLLMKKFDDLLSDFYDSFWNILYYSFGYYLVVAIILFIPQLKDFLGVSLQNTIFEVIITYVILVVAKILEDKL